MRSLSLVQSILVISVCGLSLLCVKPVSSIPLSNTGISASEFTSIAGGIVATLDSTFDFAPGTTGGDGKVTSTVYQGIGAAAGLYVYTYQLFHFRDSSEEWVDAIRIIDFITQPVEVTIGGKTVTSFYVIGTGTPQYGPPGGASWEPAHLQFKGEHNRPVNEKKTEPHWLAKGEFSAILGVFSPLPPAVGEANVEDSGKQTYPSVLVPTPEPGAALLVFMGLIGLALPLRRRKLSD